jgi:peroxiredoxin
LARVMEGAARRVTQPGKVMELSGKTPAGKTADLKDYRGKVVLVDFWATWCGPCVGELPNIRKLYGTYHDKGFEVLAVSVDQDEAALAKFLDKEKLPWVCLRDPDGDDSLATRFGIMSIPQAILVGRDGRVLSIGARGTELERLLKKHIADKIEQSGPMGRQT